jgi:hypothetical protein
MGYYADELREEYNAGYEEGYEDGLAFMRRKMEKLRPKLVSRSKPPKKRSRKLSGWQKFIKNNSKKRKFKYRDGKLNLKKMGIAYRKTREYKMNRKKKR